MAPFGVVARWTWVCAGGLVVLTAALGCGRSRQSAPDEEAGGAPTHPDTAAQGGGGASGADPGTAAQGGAGGSGAGNEPRSLSNVDFCLSRARFWCDRATDCCSQLRAVVNVDACYAERAELCYSEDEPSRYDPIAAAACLRDEVNAWAGCFAREDSGDARTAADSCGRAAPPDLPALGESCTSECRQEPDVSVYCDTRSDGVGSFACERGGKPAPVGGSCGPDTRCAEPARCVGTRCSLPLEDGTACSGQGQCASGYCCASTFCPEGSTCQAGGQPLVEEAECVRLVQLANNVVFRTASRNFVAVDGVDLYWNEGLDVWHSALDGSGADVLVTLPATHDHARYYPLGLIFDGPELYFLESDAVVRYDSITELTYMAAFAPPDTSVLGTSFAATDSAFYVGTSGCRQLARVAKDFSDKALFETGSTDSNAGYVAVGPDSVYCVSDAGIYAMPLTGGPVQKLTSLDAWGGPALYYDGYLYFTNVDHQNPPQGKPMFRALSLVDHSLADIAILTGISLGLVFDDENRTFYFGDGNYIGAHTLGRFPDRSLTAGEPVRALAQSAAFLYYLADSGIRRVPKPAEPQP